MTHTAPAESSFTVLCSYCDGTHTASLDTAPYGGTYYPGGEAYGVLYGVSCPATGRRYGLYPQTASRV